MLDYSIPRGRALHLNPRIRPRNKKPPIPPVRSPPPRRSFTDQKLLGISVTVIMGRKEQEHDDLQRRYFVKGAPSTPPRLPWISRLRMWRYLYFPRADYNLRRLLDAHRVQHDLLVARRVQFRSADAEHLRARITAAKCRHARPLGVAAAVAAEDGAVGDQPREVLDDGRFEGRKAGADDAYVHFQERPAVGDRLVVWCLGWIS